MGMAFAANTLITIAMMGLMLCCMNVENTVAVLLILTGFSIAVNVH
jgi:hypothetical protein